MNTAALSSQSLNFRFHQVAKWRGLSPADAHLLAHQLLLRTVNCDAKAPSEPTGDSLGDGDHRLGDVTAERR